MKYRSSQSKALAGHTQLAREVILEKNKIV